MSRPDILVMGPYPPLDMASLDADYTVHRYWEAADKDALLAQCGGQIRAIATRGDLGAKGTLIASLPKLEVISCFGVGTDAIDLGAARARGIKVTNTPDVLTDDVADLALGLLIGTARLMPQGDQHVRTGAWKTAELPLATRFHGKRLGIVGLGRIGMAVASRAAGFKMAISYHNRNPRPDVPYLYRASVQDLAANSDFLVVTAAGGPTTAGIISRAVLHALGPNGIFVNVARGSVVDEAALLEALTSGAIKGAGLDVFLNEPKIDERFFTLPNVFLQPHVGSGTVETRKAMGQLMRDNLAAHFAGRPLLTPVA